ncbi:MAG: GxxExxY protein [Candidatus Levybacteria bacterium]|nr:GxxExxY protein [Candidatus Levybacteria bacterium]
MTKLVYPELSYKLRGILFDVHGELGGEFEEKYYQRAVEKLPLKDNLQFARELKVNIELHGEKIGVFFIDFLVENKIVLELKTVPSLFPIHFRQIRSYLKVNNLQLGILANFRGPKLIFQRILSRINSD